MRTANDEIQRIAAREAGRLEYLDVATPMLNSNTGLPRGDIFVADRLHMNAAGYAIWTQIVRPRLEAAMNRSWPANDQSPPPCPPQPPPSPPACFDDPTYVERGWSCASWRGWPCRNAASWSFTPAQIAQLVASCPESCQDVPRVCAPSPPPPYPLCPPPVNVTSSCAVTAEQRDSRACACQLVWSEGCEWPTDVLLVCE